MINIIKWFWASISFKQWTFEGRKIVNPLLIIWRLLMLPIVYILLALICGILITMGNVNAAEDIWDSGTPYY